MCFAADSHIDWQQCDANFNGSQRKKCARCARGRHACEQMTDRNVVKLFNEALRLRRAAAEVAEGGEEEDEEEGAAAAAANALTALKAGIRAYHGNKNKMTGSQYTPRKGGAGGAAAGGGVVAEATLTTLQSIDRSLRALVEVGREVSYTAARFRFAR